MSPLTPIHVLRDYMKRAAQPPAPPREQSAAPPRRATPPPVLTDDERRLAVAQRQAAAICRAAAKARGEIVDEPAPLDPIAAAILAAGEKRRSGK